MSQSFGVSRVAGDDCTIRCAHLYLYGPFFFFYQPFLWPFSFVVVLLYACFFFLVLFVCLKRVSRFLRAKTFRILDGITVHGVLTKNMYNELHLVIVHKHVYVLIFLYTRNGTLLVHKDRNTHTKKKKKRRKRNRNKKQGIIAVNEPHLCTQGRA